MIILQIITKFLYFREKKIMIAPFHEKPPLKARKIPSKLIKELINGVPYYYKGYKSVLYGHRKFEEIMGSSSLQSVIVGVLNFFINLNINRKLYWVATNEAGLNLTFKNNFATDLGIFEKKELLLDNKYFSIAPKIVIEVDVNVETDKELDYIFSKSEELLKFGSEKVCWVISKNRKIILFNKGENTQVFNWDQDVFLMEGIVLNMEKLAKEENLVFE